MPRALAVISWPRTFARAAPRAALSALLWALCRQAGYANQPNDCKNNYDERLSFFIFFMVHNILLFELGVFQLNSLDA
jgi:hypothetical protein